ncbi:MAG: hypothetical protein P4L79_10875 [Legionella sp.]|uniref:hypothetical protein n=1 Tax=Legionella sp. TaxID=459 RepID=UPI0028448A1A|nr:hypothetical protein [Legionella sp.]
MGLFDRRKQKWNEIKALLFPAPEYRVDPDGDKYAVLKALDVNLTAVLEDLRDGKNDVALQDTLQYCIAITQKIRGIMEVNEKFEVDMMYIIVDFDEELMK